MDEKNGSDSWVGVIPDFFHDILAYLIPGYTALVLYYIDLHVIGSAPLLNWEAFGFLGATGTVVCAYVLGRAFEQVGYATIHKREWPFFINAPKERKPKWRLLFDKENDFYTKTFKDVLIRKIADWLENQNGKELLEECNDPEKARDEYFNLIQFYLRERFPAVALYEKKQNAAIVLSRSLAVLFFLNFFFHPLLLIVVNHGFNDLCFDPVVFLWLCANAILCWIFYFRFIQDNEYHAMYIFETFIATKRLLKKKNIEPDSNGSV